jgi:nicotinate-nucleotide pyrophosphorylase (carboxylating)
MTMDHDFAQVSWNEQLEDDCRQIVRLAVREDLDRYCDWTTVSLVPAGTDAKANLAARTPGVISGLRAAQLALEEMEARVQIILHKQDGDRVSAKDIAATLEGSARDMLTTERILLNLMGRLSGIATLTSQFVDKVSHTQARIYDTRKTTPGWRRLEKYAVSTGGGHNHRVGLFAAVMIKDNHLVLSKDHGMSPTIAIKKTKAYIRHAAKGDANLEDFLEDFIIEVEVDTFQQLKQVLQANPDIVLLDNMSCEELRTCVAFRNQQAPHVELEASGGVNLDTIAAIAETNVDRISVGALTHSAVNFDLGLDWL